MEFVDTAIAFVTQQGSQFAINLVSAVVVFFVGKWVANLLTRLIGKIATRANLDQTLVKFASHLAHAAMMAFVILAALDRLGVNTTSFAAVVAATGLAVGLALQSSLSNFAAGVMLILFKPFKVGDFVEAGGSSGTVEAIRIFNTFMRTGDNIQIVVPNGKITSDTIRNFSAKDTRRIDLIVGCGYGDDLKAVKQFLESCLNNEERILADPEPVVAVHELGDSSVNFVVRPWVKASDYWAVRWDLNETIKLGFDEHGFSIPYPTQDIHVHTAAAS